MHNSIKGGVTPCNMSLPDFNILYNLHFYNAQVKSWETPNLHSQFSTTLVNLVAQLIGTSAWSPHDSPTLRSPHRTIMLFAQLGCASKSPHTGASARDTPPFTISTLHHFVVHGAPSPGCPSTRPPVHPFNFTQVAARLHPGRHTTSPGSPERPHPGHHTTSPESCLNDLLNNLPERPA